MFSVAHGVTLQRVRVHSRRCCRESLHQWLGTLAYLAAHGKERLGEDAGHQGICRMQVCLDKLYTNEADKEVSARLYTTGQANVGTDTPLSERASYGGLARVSTSDMDSFLECLCSPATAALASACGESVHRCFWCCGVVNVATDVVCCLLLLWMPSAVARATAHAQR